MKKDITFAVVGSRSFADIAFVHKAISSFFNTFNEYNPIKFVSGGAIGPDTFGEQWANDHNIKTLIFKPDWKRYGNQAGYIRNKDIINACDICIVFWDGTSKGTLHDIQLCKKMHKPLVLWKPEFGNNMMYIQNTEDTISIHIQDSIYKHVDIVSGIYPDNVGTIIKSPLIC